MRPYLRIAQVAPLYERVPPEKYGGTERVVSYLTERLVRDGHEVSLYASADSVTAARLHGVCPRALRLAPVNADALVYHTLLLERLARDLPRYDVVHFHLDYLPFPLTRRFDFTHVSTLHGRLDLPDLVPLYQEFSEIPVVSISAAQRCPLPWLRWKGTVAHGLPLDLHRVGPGDGGYLAFLGRVSIEKRLDRAIEIATRVGMPLKVAAKVDRADREYHDRVIRPMLRCAPHVEFVGEIGEEEKGEFLGRARALLFPIDWPEPFGMVMIEAMACGTPVIAFDAGSVREVIDEGTTGFIVGNVAQASRVVERLGSFDRARCRRAFEERFSDARMAADYVTLYRGLLKEREASAEERRRGRRGRDYPAQGPVLRSGDLFAS